MLGMGISRSADGVIPIERLDEAVRNYYNARAPRAMAVRRPLAVVVDNWPDIKTETLEAPDFPDDPSRGTHARVWSKHLFIERSDWRDVDNAQ
jgi:glutaminyl-tRNA synthetase